MAKLVWYCIYIYNVIMMNIITLPVSLKACISFKHETSTHTLTPKAYIHWVPFKGLFMRLSQPWLRFLFIHFLTPLIVRYLSFQLQHPHILPPIIKRACMYNNHWYSQTLALRSMENWKHNRMDMQHHTKLEVWI